MIKRFKEMMASNWAKNKTFRILITTALLVFTGISVFVLYWNARLLLGHLLDFVIITIILIFGYVVRKEGYMRQASPKVRRVQCIVGGGLLTGFGILTALRILLGPLSSAHSFLLFLILTMLGAYIGDKMGRNLGWY